MKNKWKISLFVVPIILILAFIMIGAGTGKPGASGAPQDAGQFSTQTKNPQPEIVPGVVMVKIKSHEVAQSLVKAAPMTGLASLDAKLFQFGATSVKKAFRHKPIPVNSNIPDISRILKIEIPKQLSPVLVARELAGDPNVEYAEPVYVRQLYAVPNDPMYSQQHYLPQIHAPEAWDVQKGDSTVLIAIVDTGVDYKHEDLAANVWTNELEANGVTGVDDDGNGFVDDIHGWDFGDDDADPIDSPAGGHGTVCIGLACAVTNNAIGIAGVSWNCRFMPIKGMADDGSSAATSGFDGIIYAADNGADVISISWGSLAFLQWEQDVINYAHSKGAIIVCAAGNFDVDWLLYPASYQHAVSVAAVNRSDQKASYSSFGPWVDISAPGGDWDGGLLTTIPGNKYTSQNMQGTSLSTPVAAGIFGLVKAQHPEWTNDQIVRQVLLTADNIDGRNPQYANRLGHGRVNAFRALTDTVLTEPDARLALFSFSISDSLYGNDNDVLERGETLQLRCNIQNCSIGGTNAATLRLSCASAGVEILNGTMSPVSLPADTTLPFDFTIKIADNAPAAIAELVLKLETSRGYSREEKMEVTIGKMALLLVDNDFGHSNFVIPDVEPFFRDILNKNRVLYGYWDTQCFGFPSAQTLQQFPILVLSASWLGCHQINEQERNALRTYLDGGGNLFVCGQDVAWYLFEVVGTAEAKAILRDYLHAEYIADISDDQEVKGVESDPISDGMSFHLWQPVLIADWQSPDVIAPTTGASTIFTYSDGRAGAVKYAGDHKVVYLGFGLEAVDSRETTKIGDPSPIRTELFMRILNWLNFIEHEPLRTTENVTAARPVTAEITGNVSDLQDVTLFWRLQGDQDFTPVPMIETGTKQFAAEFPGPGTPATVEYYLQTGHPYYDWQSPVGAPDSVYSYYVGPDTVKPVIALVKKVRNHLSDQEPCPVSAVIKDNLGIAANGVYAHVRVKNRTVADSVLLTAAGEVDHFAGELPLKFSVGDTVEYRVTARDVSVAGNIGSSAWQNFVVGYEDFEGGLESWLADSAGWRLFLNGHSGKNSVNSSWKGYYPPNQDVSLTSKYGVDLSHVEKALLSFWTAHFIEEDNDAGFIEVSTDGAATWQRLNYTCSGTDNQWKADSVSLSEFCGTGFDDVRLRFRFISDATQSQRKTGWYIDDVSVIPGVEVAVAENEPELLEHFALLQNYPNPFNPTTTIAFALPKASFVTLKIYDLLGNEVATLVAEKLPEGKHQRVWEASRLASGVYLYRIEAGDLVQTKKLILLR